MDLYSRVPLLYLAEAAINGSSLKGSTAHLILRVAYDASIIKLMCWDFIFSGKLFWNVLESVEVEPKWKILFTGPMFLGCLVPSLFLFSSLCFLSAVR